MDTTAMVLMASTVPPMKKLMRKGGRAMSDGIATDDQAVTGGFHPLMATKKTPHMLQDQPV